MRVGVVGFGNMGSAFAEGVSRKVGRENVITFDIDPARRDLALGRGFPVASDLKFLTEESQILIVAVKPKDLKAVFDTIKEGIGDRVVISVAAGVDIRTLKELSGTDRVVRLMPNINALVGRAVIAISFGEGVSEEEKDKLSDLLSACGKLYPLSEDLFDVFTAIAGSGPAFVMSFIEALALSGVLEGIPYERSLDIALETVAGTVELLKEKGGNPSEWVVRVTSPGGTTIEGLKVLEEKGFKGIVMECVRRTSEKARKLRG